MTIARSAIFSRVLQETGLGRDITATGGNATSFVASAELGGPDIAERQVPNGSVLYCYSEATGTTDALGKTTFSTAHTLSSGSLTISPALGGSGFQADDKILLMRPELKSYTKLTRALTRALTALCTRWVLVPLTELVDGDMEASDATDWPSDGTAVVAKMATSTAGDAFVSQVLTITNLVTASGYAYQTVDVYPGEVWQIVVVGRASSLVAQTPKLVVYDVQNAAEITLSGGGGELEPGTAWNFVSNSFTIPTGCRQIQVRLGVKTGGDDVRYAWAALWRVGDRSIFLPRHVPSPEHVGNVYRVSGGDQGDYYGMMQSGYGLVPDVRRRTNSMLGGVELEFGHTLGSGPYVYEKLFNYPDVTTDTDTTPCQDDYIVAATAYELVNELYNDENVEPHGPTEPNRWTGLRRTWRAKYEDADRLHGAKVQIIPEISAYCPSL